MGDKDDDEVEAIATRSAKKQRPDAEIEVVEVLSD